MRIPKFIVLIFIFGLYLNVQSVVTKIQTCLKLRMSALTDLSGNKPVTIKLENMKSVSEGLSRLGATPLLQNIINFDHSFVCAFVFSAGQLVCAQVSRSLPCRLVALSRRYRPQASVRFITITSIRLTHGRFSRIFLLDFDVCSSDEVTRKSYRPVIRNSVAVRLPLRAARIKKRREMMAPLSVVVPCCLLPPSSSPTSPAWSSKSIALV